jgi:hypothetical protein
MSTKINISTQNCQIIEGALVVVGVVENSHLTLIKDWEWRVEANAYLGWFVIQSLWGSSAEIELAA